MVCKKDQHGFLPKRSTCTQLLATLNEMSLLSDAKMQVDVVYIAFLRVLSYVRFFFSYTLTIFRIVCHHLLKQKSSLMILKFIFIILLGIHLPSVADPGGGGGGGGSKGSKDPPPSARPVMNKLTYE